jgi:hypothetical protein
MRPTIVAAKIDAGHLKHSTNIKVPEDCWITKEMFLFIRCWKLGSMKLGGLDKAAVGKHQNVWRLVKQ